MGRDLLQVCKENGEMIHLRTNARARGLGNGGCVLFYHNHFIFVRARPLVVDTRRLSLLECVI